MMVGALVNNGVYTQNQMDRLMDKISRAENILWDSSSSYLPAFYAADAIITDGTTFSFEFLYTKKPILLTPRNMESFYQYEDMLESYYIVNHRRDISNFMDMIAKGEDPLKEKRLAMYEKTFFIPTDCTDAH
jgi:CDP-glycerol glycerophosphotransferase (TagB/SpsB family)